MKGISFESQSIGLNSIFNARELGGITLPDGRTIKRGRLLRTGSLAAASEDDLRKLADEFNLKLIFDFRTDGEVRRSPDLEVEGARRVWLPAIDQNTEKVGAAALPEDAYRNIEDFVLHYSDNPFVQNVARQMYPEMAFNEYTQLQYASFLQQALTVDDGAILWHCSQGKDRTGFGAAFILSALGADKETIMADYSISNEFYRDSVEQICGKLDEMGYGENEKAVVRTFVGVNPEYFGATLDMIDLKYGSLHNYVHEVLMFSEEDEKRLRGIYLD